MTALHEPGCDLHHTVRQQCNVPRDEPNSNEAPYPTEPDKTSGQSIRENEESLSDIAALLAHAARATFDLRCAFAGSSAARNKKIARDVALELIPLIAVAIGALSIWLAVVALEFTDRVAFITPLYVFGLVLLLGFFVSGLGWFAAGYQRMGAFVLIGRGFATILLGFIFLLAMKDSVRCSSAAQCDEYAPYILFLVIVSTGAAVASAVVLMIVETGAPVAPSSSIVPPP